MALTTAPTIPAHQPSTGRVSLGGPRSLSIQILNLAAPTSLATSAFLVYLWTMAPTVTWKNGGADGAELAAAAYVWGVAHPPGYPLYLLVARLLELLPTGDLAHRAALLSVSAAAGAALAVYGTTLALLRSRDQPIGWRERASSLFAGAIFAFAPLVWSQAVITEVYTFGALLLGLFLLALVRWDARPSSGRTLVAIGAFALLVSHQPTFAVALPLLAGLAWRRRLRLVLWLQAVAILALVPLLFLTLWLRASFHPMLDWGDPSTPERWLAHVTAASYHGYFLARPLADELPRVPYGAALLLRQIGWPAALLALLGLQWLWTERRQLALVASLLAAFFVVFAILYNAEDGQVYLIPTVELLAVVAGLGAGWLLSVANRRFHLLLLAGLTGSMGWQVVTGWPTVDASRDTQARDWGVAALQQAPRDATLRTRSDDQTFVLWYLQAVEGLRPDVVVVEERLLPEEWYRAQLRRQHPRLEATS